MQFLLGGFAVLFWKIKSGGVQAGGTGGAVWWQRMGDGGVCVIDVQSQLR